MWFRQSTISEIVERPTPVSTTNTGVASFTERSEPIPQTPVVQLLTLEEASAKSQADSESTPIVLRLRGAGGDSVVESGGFRTHTYTSVTTTVFNIESF